MSASESLSHHSRSSQIIAGFLCHCEVEKGLAPTTIQQYRSQLTKFAESCAGRSMLTLGERSIRRYLANYGEAAGPRSQARAVSVLRMFFRFLRADGLRADNPTLRIDPPHFAKSILMPLSRVEAERLMDCTTGDTPLAIRDRAILELLYASGLRVTELVTARTRDLQIEGRTLSVHGKGDKWRVVPFGKPAALALSNYLEKGRPKLVNPTSPDTLFIDRRGTLMTRQRVFQVVQQGCRAAGLRPIGPHTLRRSLGAHMLEAGANLRAIQEICGHASIETTQLYTRITTDHLKRQVQEHHPRSHPRAQMDLFTPLGTPGRSMCMQCRESVCERSKNLCENHLKLAIEAVKRSRDKNRRRPPQRVGDGDFAENPGEARAR